MKSPPLNTEIRLSPDSIALARRTLLNTTLPEDAVLIGAGVEDVSNIPTIYFDFRCWHGTVSRVYAEEERPKK